MSPPIPEAELMALLAGLRPPTADAAVTALADAGLQPEPLCRACGGPLAVRDLDLGIHAGCEPETPPGAEPAPTLPDLAAALVAFESGSARSQQVAVGPSQVGTPCDRRLGYALAGTPPQPGDGLVKWAAMLGTAGHAMNAEALTLANERLGRQRWLIEQGVTAEAGLSGNTDAYDCDNDMVVDWKFTGKSTIDKVRRHGPGQQYEWQAHVYGRGHQRSGRDPKWVRIVFLPRTSSRIDDTYEWTARYSRLTADRAMDRVADVKATLIGLDVAGHPENWSRVASADDCYFCPFRRKASTFADATGCPGIVSKSGQAVNDYLSTLPVSS